MVYWAITVQSSAILLDHPTFWELIRNLFPFTRYSCPVIVMVVSKATAKSVWFHALILEKWVRLMIVFFIHSWWLTGLQQNRRASLACDVAEWNGNVVCQSATCFPEITIFIERAPFFDFRIRPGAVDKGELLGHYQKLLCPRKELVLNKSLSLQQDW
jgi:hypothetical protein